ncbi:MAG: hypothetical protein ABII00_02790 [Elusimicrobiota bacterium]
MKDKVTLLMEETGCDRSEAELALQLCGYDLESAVQAVPRLFQNIMILKGRFRVESESLYGLWLAILNLRERRLLRARAVISYNPAVFASELDQHWFDFEGRLYACRLWSGTMQQLSQEVEGLLTSLFDAPEAGHLYEEGAHLGDEAFEPLRALLAKRLGGGVELQARQDVLDMSQFQEVRPMAEAPRDKRPKSRIAKRAGGSSQGPVGLLILNVALEPDAEGAAASELRAGDLVYAAIDDQRDIAQYLARLLGVPATGLPHPREEGPPRVPVEPGPDGKARSVEEAAPLLVPVEAIERAAGEVTIRVRFSAGVCGDVSVPEDLRVRVSRRTGRTPWWRKIFGR